MTLNKHIKPHVSILNYSYSFYYHFSTHVLVTKVGTSPTVLYKLFPYIFFFIYSATVVHKIDIFSISKVFQYFSSSLLSLLWIALLYVHCLSGLNPRTVNVLHPWNEFFPISSSVSFMISMTILDDYFIDKIFSDLSRHFQRNFSPFKVTFWMSNEQNL